ncbi:MAG TPA: hypothetical protein HPP87_08295 [Planctomycetes bacterium]|nr:hypothetical protein [Planctomycetota bacterium]
MVFLVKHDFLLMILAGFVMLGFCGCSQQVAIETTDTGELAADSALEAGYNQADKSVEHVVSTNGEGVTYEPWYALGPFYNITFEQVMGPEKGPDLTREYEQDTPFKYKWKLHPEWKDGEGLDLKLPPKSNMYFYRIAEAEAAGAVEFTVGTGDGLQVWVNGREVFKRFEVGNANTEKISTEFKKGKNTILLKVYNEASASELFFEK